MSSEIEKAIEKAITGGRKRKFIESVDISVSVKDVNLKDPSKRFRAEIILPNPVKKDVRIAVVGDEATISNAKLSGAKYCYSQDDVSALSKEPKKAKKFAKEHDFVLVIPQLMGDVGKNLGRYLGPIGKAPNVLPPNIKPSIMIERYKKTCKVRLRQNPIIHVRVGTKNMKLNELEENIKVVLSEIENKLEQGSKNIRNIHVKTTMGPSIRVSE